MTTIGNIKDGFKLSNGIVMPYLGLGTYQASNDKEVIKSVAYALDLGYRHIDTASIYRNEEGVGKGILESDVDREEIFVVSKVWNSDQGYKSTLEAYERSLERLGLEYLDLYLIHWPVTGKYKDTWKALEELYRNGKVKSIGVSNFMKPHLEDLATVSTITPMVNQMEFHPYLVQQELLDYCKKHNIQYEAWSPFMQGKLFTLDILDELAKKYEKTIAQIVLRWNLQKGVVTIPKSVKAERIKSNCELFDFVLSDDEIAFIDSFDRDERIGPDPFNFNF